MNVKVRIMGVVGEQVGEQWWSTNAEKNREGGKEMA